MSGARSDVDLSSQFTLQEDASERPNWQSRLRQLCSQNGLGFKIFGLHDLKPCWKRLSVAFFFGLGGLYLNCVSQAHLQKVTEETDLVLDDLGFRTLPFLGEEHVHLPDMFCNLFMGVTLARFFILPGPNSMRWIIIRRWVVILGMLFVLRGFSIIATVLPNPAKNCEKKITYQNIWREAFYLMLGQDVTCTDVLYSGHTINITLCALLWIEYNNRAPYVRDGWVNWLVKFAVSAWSLTAYVVIVASHWHYTVDVWIGFWMTFFVFRYFHKTIRVVELQCRTGRHVEYSCTLLMWKRAMYGPISFAVGWLEQDAPLPPLSEIENFQRNDQLAPMSELLIMNSNCQV